MLESGKYNTSKNISFAAISPYKAKATIIQTEINYARLENYNSLISEVI